MIQVRLTNGHSQIILADREGRAIRFPESKVRPMGRNTSGVRGMTLAGPDDEVVGMITMTGDKDETVMVVSEKGYGKRSDLDSYRITNRGGKGVITLNITDKTGKLIAIKNVNDSNDLMIINQSGITLRLPLSTVRVMSRYAQGVKLIDLTKRGDSIASVCKVDSDPTVEAEEEAMADMETSARLDADKQEALSEVMLADAEDTDARKSDESPDDSSDDLLSDAPDMNE